MQILKYLFLCLAFTGILSSCGSDDEAPIVNETDQAKELALGDWVSVRVSEGGIDITSTTSGTFSFKEDDTFSATAMESGFSFNFDGTYEFMDDGKRLKLDYPNSGGLAQYDVITLTNTNMTLEIETLGVVRVSDFVRQ